MIIHDSFRKGKILNKPFVKHYYPQVRLKHRQFVTFFCISRKEPDKSAVIKSLFCLGLNNAV